MDVGERDRSPAPKAKNRCKLSLATVFYAVFD